MLAFRKRRILSQRDMQFIIQCVCVLSVRFRYALQTCALCSSIKHVALVISIFHIRVQYVRARHNVRNRMRGDAVNRI